MKKARLAGTSPRVKGGYNGYRCRAASAVATNAARAARVKASGVSTTAMTGGRSVVAAGASVAPAWKLKAKRHRRRAGNAVSAGLSGVASAVRGRAVRAGATAGVVAVGIQCDRPAGAGAGHGWNAKAARAAAIRG